MRASTLLLTAGLALLPSTADAAHVKGQFSGFRSLQNPVWAEAKDPKNHGELHRVLLMSQALKIRPDRAETSDRNA